VSGVTGSTPQGSSSGDVERVLPAQGGYDPDRVAGNACTKDPGLPEELARELAVYAWDHLRAIGELDAPELARRLLADHPDAGATPANVVARAAVDLCRAHGVDPA
jgi:hypothetical protein